MSFLLNYLDGALDTVTGRYDGDEGDDTSNDEGSTAGAVDGDDNNTEGVRDEVCSSSTPASAAAGTTGNNHNAVEGSSSRSSSSPAGAVSPHAPARPESLGARQGLMESKVREALLLDQQHRGKSPPARQQNVDAAVPSSKTSPLLMQPAGSDADATAQRKGQEEEGLLHAAEEAVEKSVREDERRRREEEKLRQEAEAIEAERRRQRVLQEEEEKRLEEAAAAAAAAVLQAEERERERLRVLEDEERERARERERQRALDRERDRQRNEERRAAAEAAAAAAAAAAEKERSAREKEEEESRRLMRARQEAEERDNQRRLAAQRHDEVGGRPLPDVADAKAEEEQHQEDGVARERRGGGSVASRESPPRAAKGQLVTERETPFRDADTAGLPASSPTMQQDAAASAVVPAAVTTTTTTSRSRAREEAWAAARTLAEQKARSQAMRNAALRATAQEEQGGARTNLTDTGNGAGASPAACSEEPVAVAPHRDRGGGDGPESNNSSNLATVTLDSPVAENGQRADAMRPPVAVPAAPEVASGGWRGFFAGRRQEGGGEASATSSVSGSQVSTVVATEPANAGTAAAGNSRQAGPHDFVRVKSSRRRRGTGGPGGNVTSADPDPPPMECAACLGQWDTGGSAVTRWYRCRRCGGTVHGACRQFFQAGEACAHEQGGGGLARPAGWRDPVNRAGVVQVGVLQAFDLSLKPGESIYVALRLLPWKERVKTGSAKWGDLGASWPSQASARHDLLHLYNSDATPVPTLRVEVWRSAMRVLDDLLGYASINMAPLLARPGSTSERWHVLSDPNNASTTGDPRLPAGDVTGSSPPSSAGTILLSLGFTPTGGTPSIRPLPATPLVGSSNRTPRHASSESPAAGSSKSNFGWGGGDNGKRTPRAETPAIPEGFSLGEPAMPDGGGSGNSSSGAAERADVLSSTQRVVDGRSASSAVSHDGNVGHGEGLDDAERDGGKGDLLLPEEAAGETPEEKGGDVEVDTGSGAVVELNDTQEQEQGQGQGTVHLFRVKSYPAPVWCEICEGLLLGMRNQGFCCEACGMNVHRGCQLRANFSKSCPGQVRKGTGSGGKEDGGAPEGNRSGREVEEGVGLIQIHLRSAHRCGTRCHGGHHSYLDNERGGFMGSGTYSAAASAAASAGTPTATDPFHAAKGDAEKKSFHINGGMFSPGRRRGRGSGWKEDDGFFRGDHYCRVRVGRKGGPSDLLEEVRTEAVFQTPDPVFERTWVFVAPSYDSCVTIDLVDASTDRPAGRFETTVIGLLQADYDARAVGKTPPSHEHRNIRLLSPGVAEDEANITGLLQARVEFDESTEALFGPNGILGPGGGGALRLVPPRQKADLGVETLKSLVARIKGVFLWVKMAKDCYSRVMSWDNPALSSISLMAFVYLTLVANAEYLLALLPFSLLMFMTWGFLQRRGGGYVQAWVSSEGGGAQEPGGSKGAGFRAVGTLKIAVVRGKGLISSDLSLPGNAYVRVSYVIPDRNASAPRGNEPLFANDISTGGDDDGRHSNTREYLVGQTVPQPTGDCPVWGSVGVGGGGGGGAGGGGGVGGTQASTRVSSVSMMDQSRGPGFLSGRSDAILQNMMDVWGRHASSGATATFAEGSGEQSKKQSKERSESTTAAQEEEDMCFVYPVLQPVLRRKGGRDGRGGSSLPWSGEESRTFLRFSVFFANPFNSLMDALQGQVLVPLSALAGKEEEGGVQPELRGWFDVSPVDDKFLSQATTTTTVAAATAPPPSPAHSSETFSTGVDDGRNARNGTDNTGSSSSSSSSKHAPDGRSTSSYDNNGGGGMGAIFLRLQLTLPDGKAAATTEEDEEASLALQTLLGENALGGGGDKGDTGGVAASSGTAAGGGAGGTGAAAGKEAARDAAAGGAVARLLGMPMGFRNTIRDVQDTIGTVLDTVEAVKNLLNWTHPPKTLLVYAVVALAWLVLLVVPGRYIVLTLGLLEFSKAWMTGGQEPELVADDSGGTPSPLAIKLRNLLLSLPVDSELAACYAWEAREHSRKEKAGLKLREQRARLKLLGAGRQWEGGLRVRDRAGDPWESRYVVVLGHRLAWWGSSKELDDGKKARGQLLLQGHAGVTHLSPLEARELNDPRKVVCVFGRSPDGLPHKVTFMAESIAAKEALENAVSSVMETKRD